MPAQGSEEPLVLGKALAGDPLVDVILEKDTVEGKALAERFYAAKRKR